MDPAAGEKQNDSEAANRGSGMSLRTRMGLILAAASFVCVAAYTYGHGALEGRAEGPLCRQDGGDAEDEEVGVPGGEEVGGAEVAPGSTTGQRVAGHLLAVLLLASVTAAIVEAVRARMTRIAAPHHNTAAAGDPASTGGPESHHHAANVPGRTSRRGTLQEKSYSYDGYIYRTRSSSVGVGCGQQSGAAAAAAASRTQKALKVRLGGRTPPLLRRSSFPVMSRTLSRVDSNGGSPALGSRKPSISDVADDDLGELGQKKRVRLIRRF